jgi:sugar phosphate isomerase/epimerase
MVPLSIQLYSVRDAAKADFLGVLKKIAAIGYRGVEFAGLHDYKPEAIRKVIDDLGLVASSAHTGLPTADKVQEIVETAEALGYNMIIAGRGPDDFKTLLGLERAAEEFQAAAGRIPRHMRLGYHNHWWEMNVFGGRLGLDLFLEMAPCVFSQVDCYWAANFGAVDVPQFISDHKGRIPILHLKDGPLLKDQPHTAVGQGKMDIPACVAAADRKVLEWVVVELDSCATDMMKAVEDSYAYLTDEGIAEGTR